MKPLPSSRGASGGWLLVEVLLASVMATVVLGVLYLTVSGAMKSIAWASVTQEAHAQFLAFREQLAQDVQQALAVVAEVTLDDVAYRTADSPPSHVLLLRLAARDSQGLSRLGVYDFVVYTVDRVDSSTAMVRRRVFATRAANGDPLIGIEPSARRPDDRVLIRHLHVPPDDDAGGPFAFDPPLVAVARDVEATVTIVATDPAPPHRAALQAYTCRFHLRNAS